MGLRKRFTRWYVKKGFGFHVDSGTGFSYHICPWYVRPFLFLFSPSIFYYETISDSLSEIAEKAKKANQGIIAFEKAVNSYLEIKERK